MHIFLPQKQNRRVLPLLAIAALSISACSPTPTQFAIDSGPLTDTSVDQIPGRISLSFSPEDDGQTSPAVTLSLESTQNQTATISIRARGIPNLQGIAFRLSFDPKELQIVSSLESAVWASSAFPYVARFAQRTEGELWAGIGFKGSNRLDSSNETLLAQVEVKPLGLSASKIKFRAHHNLVLDPDGEPVHAVWFGGTLTASPEK